MDLVKKVYLVSSSLPDFEKFGLRSQIQRSAISIPSNIAEGSGRTSSKEFIHFLKISLSSSYELEKQLILIRELYDIDVDELMLNLNNIQNMIGGFTRSLNK
jgi:four helix bundle protein